MRFQALPRSSARFRGSRALAGQWQLPCQALPRNSSGVNGTGENLRMFRVGPRSERGGMIAWTGCPPEVAHPPKAMIRRPGGPAAHN